MITLEKIAWAEGMGRSMARADMAKEELEQAATDAGQAFAKIAFAGALAKLGPAALEIAKKNPGAVIGGGLGALHGLMKSDGGVGSALMDGATGAAIGHGAQWAHGKALQDPTLGPKLQNLQAAARAKMNIGTPVSDSLLKTGEQYKEAFGAALAGALRGAVPTAMNFIKSNPLKAGIGAASGLSNFASSRKSGEGLGSSLLSGAAGAASAL